MTNNQQQKTYKKIDLTKFFILLFLPILIFIIYFIPSRITFNEIILYIKLGTIFYALYLRFILTKCMNLILVKEKSRTLKIQKSLNEIKLKSPNGDFGPYFYYTGGYQNDLQNKESNIPFTSSFNKEARIYIENNNIGIGIGNRVNLSGENQKFVDIINLSTYLKTRIYLQEFSIITNFGSNKILINYLKDNIWKTQILNIVDFGLIEEKEEQLSVFFNIVYNNTFKTYHKINYINNFGFQIGDEISKFNGYEIIEKNNNCIVLKQDNRENKSEIKVYSNEHISDTEILKNSGVIGINNDIFVENGNYYILVFTDVNFFNYSYYTNSDYKKSAKFLDKINEKVILKEDVSKKEIKENKEKNDLKISFISLFLSFSIPFTIGTILILNDGPTTTYIGEEIKTSYLYGEYSFTIILYLVIDFTLLLLCNTAIHGTKKIGLRISANIFFILIPVIFIFGNF